jgi:hypothetical protein
MRIHVVVRLVLDVIAERQPEADALSDVEGAFRASCSISSRARAHRCPSASRSAALPASNRPPLEAKAIAHEAQSQAVVVKILRFERLPRALSAQRCMAIIVGWR